MEGDGRVGEEGGGRSESEDGYGVLVPEEMRQ